MLTSERALSNRLSEQNASQTAPPPAPRLFILLRPRLCLTFLLALFVILHSLLPLGSAVQIGADEGFELAKATLCLNGAILYDQVWNDQPPLHTFLVTQVLKHISLSVMGSRLVTTGFTLVLVSSLFFIILRISGIWAAVAGTLLLIFSPGFLELSASCMLEIPSVALAVAGLAVLVTGCPTSASQDTKSPFETSAGTPREGTRPTKISGKIFHPLGPVPSPGGGSKPSRKGMRGSPEILGGVLFGAALLVKLLPAMLLPIAAIIIWTKNRQSVSANEVNKTQCEPGLQQNPINKEPLGSHWYRIARLSLKQLLLFGISISVTFVALDLLIERGAFLAHFQQSWISHFSTTKSTEYGSADDHPFDWSVLLKNWDATVPALFGISVACRQFRKNASVAVPLGWMTLSLLVFTIHKPWWQYYYIHIAIPLCWCAGIGIVAMFNRLRPSHSPLQTTESRPGPGHRAVLTMLLLFTFCATLWMGSRAYLQIKTMRDSPKLHAALVLREIERFKPFTHWFFTEEPIYSFHAGIPMPPELAVIHLKRLWAGEMTQARLAAELTQSKPELILLANNGNEVPFQTFLDAEYRLVYIDTDHRLFAHQTISRKGFR